MALTMKQTLFVEAFLRCSNATEAARRAGYSGNDNTLASIASENLRKPKVLEFLKRRLKKESAATNEVLARLSAIARANLGDVAEALQAKTPAGVMKKLRARGLDHLVKKIKRTQHGIEIELHDPV